MASLRYRARGWDLRYRERDGRERTERFAGTSARRPPQEALERKAEVESQLYRGTYIAREDREMPFRLCYERWWASRQISETRRHTPMRSGRRSTSSPIGGRGRSAQSGPLTLTTGSRSCQPTEHRLRAEPGVAQADPRAGRRLPSHATRGAVGRPAPTAA